MLVDKTFAQNEEGNFWGIHNNLHVFMQKVRDALQAQL